MPYDLQSIFNAIESGEGDISFYKEAYLQTKKCLNEHCKHPRQFQNAPLLKFEKYPVDTEGFAVAFDPLTQQKDLLDHFYKFGFVVGSAILSPEQSKSYQEKIDKLLIHANQPDIQGIPLLSRGFLDVYHTEFLSEIRQNFKLYIMQSLLWNTPDLWVSFDRIGFKPNYGESSKGLGLHVDQNIKVHPDFTTLQGVLALSDSLDTNSTFLVVPQSQVYFNYYHSFIAKDYKGEFVNLPDDSELYSLLSANAQPIGLKQGNYVVWDSRTTHSNTSNTSDTNRYACYVSMGPANEDRAESIQLRNEYFKLGLGLNNRDAYMHASKKPRFNDSSFLTKIREPERLTPLGKCLYSQEKWSTLR